MTRMRFGLILLSIGIIILLIGLYLLFNTESPWRFLFMGGSVLLNGFAIAVLSVKDD